MAVRNIADIRQIESIPLAQRDLPTSTYAAIKRTAEKLPNVPALSFFLDAQRFTEAHTWTYAELFADITRAANVFHDIGIAAGDVVAFVLPNLPETHFTIWGGEAAGIVMAINPMLDGPQITELLHAAKAKLVVTMAPSPDNDLWQKIEANLASAPSVQQVLWVSAAPYLPAATASKLTEAIAVARGRYNQWSINDLRTQMATQPSDHLKSGRKILSTDRSSYFCTGGTTGLPKIAVRTHGAEVFDAWALSANMQPRSEAYTLFCGLPLFHVNGQLVTGLFPWMEGDHVVLGTPQGYRGAVLARFWEIVAHYRINLFSGVPTIYAALLQLPTNDHDISSLHYALCGAAPMPVELFREFERKTGVRILEGYGLTEAACASTSNPPDGESRVGSIGLRLAYQDMRAAILDEHGAFVRFATTDEVGTIVIKGPNVFAGYLEESQNRGVWLDINGARWLNTGDLGREDADSYFWLTGRKKELIIRGGHNIDPKVIEEALQAHPAVAMVAAVGCPDPYAGEVPVAYVQLRPGAQVAAEALLAFATQHISERAAIPKRVEILEQLPVTAVGKIFKPALLRMEIKQTILKEAAQIGVTDIDIDVIQDPRRGLLAKIKLKTAHEALANALGHYSFQVDWSK
ncbi:MAG: acyl-CoA synthetase [Rhodocyclaceae bacterium]|nr:acyl-CoA synthetase [Rhodocyclaceae bacterium]